MSDTVPSVEQVLASIESMTSQPAAPQVTDPGQFNRFPWAGITELPDGRYTDAETMLRAAGLDWTVEFGTLKREVEHTVHEKDETGELTGRTFTSRVWVEAKDVKDVVRSSDGFVFGQVGSLYKRVQNVEAFKFADNLVDLADGRWVAAGEQYQGRVVFGVMELPQGQILIDGDDAIGMYLLVRTSHNGGTGIQISVTPVRTRCENMLSLTIRSAVQQWSFRHTATLDGQLAKARQALKLTGTYQDAFAKEMTKLLETEISNDRARFVLERVFKGETQTRREKLITGVMDAYENERYNGYTGTAYGLLNGVTDYFDHVIKRRSPTSRFQEQTDGEGAKYRNRVHAELVSG